MRILEQENESPLATVEIEVNAGEAGVDNDDAELSADDDVIIEAVEGVTDSAVAIAEIQADRDVELAQINAAVEIEHIEARKEEKGELWEAMENLSTQVQSLSETVNLLLESQLTPPILAETDPTITTPQSTLDPTTETPMELAPESVAENLETEIQESLPIKRRIRAI